MADFVSDIRQFRTVAEFAAYLATLPPPNWILGKRRQGPIGSTVHNTYKPTEAQWRGRDSMLSMQRDYVSKGWSSGPTLYLACHSPDKDHDGIWQLTPVTSPGTHAGACNVQRFGIEVVGDFHRRSWSTTQRTLLLSTLEVLHRWARLPADINGHRDCMPGRTCPGDAAYAALPRLRDDLALVLAFRAGPTPDVPRPYRVRVECAALTDRRPDAPLAAGPDDGLWIAHEGAQVAVGDITAGWAWIKTGPGRLDGPGFVPLSYLEPV